ncbi:TolB family protein [Gaoshiqia sp. Z1-71]|uniref:TolB family protein n=1 Tax=Gaoshiqia hydrogeniformans TaxID=3290090 RepID=UPI003BF7CFCB
MMQPKHFAVLIFFILVRFTAFAQYFSSGDDPAGIKWKEIVNTHFQIIFPEGYEEKANQLAHVLDHVYEYGYRTLNHPPKKISVILHTHAIKSNGLVAWSPKRVELFPTPHQKIYAQDWLEQLAIHEFRHVVQMDKIQNELPAIFPVLFGEQAATLAVGAYLPFWFIEGDAVVTETALTKAGRGRLPYFLMENKAQAVEKGLYSYNKASMGSYRDFVPNRYSFGYWMAGGIREAYGPEIWTDVLTRIGRAPLSVNPLNRALKQKTGMNKEKLYNELFQNYLDEWKSEQRALQLTRQNSISPKKQSSHTNYLYISALSGDSVIAYKESRNDIGRIVVLTNGKEKPVHTPGIILEESFSKTDELLIWAERRPDLRWTHADRSVVVVYNTNTNIRTVIQAENKLFSPVISPDHTRFAAVVADHSGKYYLAVFDLKTGEVLHRFSTPDNQFFFTPDWDTDGNTLYVIALNYQGKYLTSLNTGTGEFTALSEPGRDDIRNPHFFNGKLYFTSSVTGIDNIFSIDVETRETEQLTSVPYGADYASVKNGRLFFSNYMADGYVVAAINLNETLGKPSHQIEPYRYRLAESLAAQEDTVLDFSRNEPLRYGLKPYRKLAHLFNFHSWAPAYINVNDYEVKPGVSLMSQNKLGTASTHLGYEYDLTEKAGKYKANFEYSGLFPVIETEFAYGNRKSKYYEILERRDNQGNVISRDTTLKSFSWKELDIDFGLRLPLYFNSGKYTQLLQPEVTYGFRKVIHDDTTPDRFFKGYYHFLSYRFYFKNVIRMAELDLQPDWGQVFELIYRHSPSGDISLGHLNAFRSNLYFPGFMRNHGFRFYNGYQQKSSNSDVGFSDMIRYPRGFSSFNNTDFYSFAADYVMPLCYPDLSLGRLFFLKRIRTSLFYDYANLKGNIYNNDGTIHGKFNANLKSLGLELNGDGHFLRFVAPVSVGLRGIYLPDYRDFNVEFLLSIDFNAI